MRLQRAEPVPKFRAFQPLKPALTFVYVDLEVPTSRTTVSGVDGGPTSDYATIESITSLVGVQVEVYVVSTSDYNWNPWTVTYDFDGTIPTAGNVGANDNDNGTIS